MQLFNPVQLAGIDFEFLLFALLLLGIAIFHRHTLKVALAGLAFIVIYKLLFTPFNYVLLVHEEWMGLLNLFGLLTGFTILSDHFEHSGVPAILPRYLPKGWKGAFSLLVVIFLLSSVLDNIAAVMVGARIASLVYKRKVHIGYLVAIVAVANAGGSGSVLGDTTTTMMWIAGIKASSVFKAYAAAVPALFFSGIIASVQQHKYQSTMAEAIPIVSFSWRRIMVSLLILGGAIIVNFIFGLPALGEWLAIIIGSFIIPTHWRALRTEVSGAFFLLALVFAASTMPVEHLPKPSWQSTLGIGFISSVFDNIPLTKLALAQRGYDWGLLAFAVGFGGSMMWFGSSAGVALSGMFEEVKSVGAWLKGGWHVIVAYLLSFLFILWLWGWHP